MSKANHSWKQPTPTDIRTNENIDTLSRMLFLDIFNGCQNKPYHKVYYHGNKRIDLELQRGQYLLNIAKYQRDLGIPRKRIEKSLEIISKWYNEMIIERKPFGCVITLKNYGELVEMKNETTNEVKTKLKRSENEVKSKNKSVYIEKTEENIINNRSVAPSVYGNEQITKTIKAFNAMLPIKLPDDYKARRTVKNILEVCNKYSASGTIKPNRDWLDDDLNTNLRAFASDYLKIKIENGYAPQSWRTLYGNFQLWVANKGDLSKLLKGNK